MRLLIVTSIYPPDIGGPATYIDNLFRSLQHKHQIKIITFLNTKKNKNTSHIQYIPITGNALTRQLNLFKAVWSDSHKADLIFVQDPFVVGVISLLVAIMRHKSCVLKFVGDVVWETAQSKGHNYLTLEKFYETKKFNIKQFISLFLQRWVLANVKCIIVPSNYLKHFLIKYHHINPGKITTIYNGISLNQLTAQKKMPNSAVTVARLVPWKQIDVIIKAVSQVKACTYTIIGDGPQKTYLSRLIQDYKVADRVKIISGLDHKRVLQLLAANELFILNSSYEGLPHVLLEAALSGNVIITPKLPGIAEIFTADEVIYINKDNPNDLINSLNAHIENKTKGKNMALKAKKKIEEQFNWEKTFSETEKILINTYKANC